MFTSCFFCTEPLRFQPSLERLNPPHQNGLKRSLMNWLNLPGRGDSGPFRSVNPMWLQLKHISLTKKSIIRRFRLKTSYAPFWRNIRWNRMSVIFGIRAPFQGLVFLLFFIPRALPWAVTSRPFGALSEGKRVTAMETLLTNPAGTTEHRVVVLRNVGS